ALDERFRAAQASFPGVTAALGANIFEALNCAGCHRGSMEPRAVAPPLAQEAQRVNLPWLQNYLRRPTAIRPFGYHPGQGSRMPDFRLSAEEVGIISSFLTAEASANSTASPLKTRKERSARRFEPRTLSHFAERKAQ